MTVLSVSRKWKISSEGPGEGGEEEAKRKNNCAIFPNIWYILTFWRWYPDCRFFIYLNSFEIKAEKLSLPRRLKEKSPGRSGARGEKRRGAKVFRGCRNLVSETWNWTPASLFPSALKGQDFYTVLSESDTKIRLRWIKLVPEALNLLLD